MRKPFLVGVALLATVVIVGFWAGDDDDESKTLRDEIQTLKTKELDYKMRLLQKDMIIQGLSLTIMEQAGQQDELRALYAKHEAYINKINDFIVDRGGPGVETLTNTNETVKGDAGD